VRTWDTKQILRSLDLSDDVAMADDVIDVRTSEYRLLRYPERLLSPTFPPAQVAWSKASRSFDVVFDEVVEIVRGWGVDAVHWWVTAATQPTETEAMLRSRGGKLSDSYQIFARELAANSLGLQAPEDVIVELVHDERTLRAALSVEERGWGRGPLDERGLAYRLAETLGALENWSEFQLVAFIGEEPASTGRCTLDGEVARLWGAVTVLEFRRRGCYGAILSERACHAQARGATLALTRGRPLTSGPTLERAGFTSHGEERCYRVDVS
jgi:hypothetical protein